MLITKYEVLHDFTCKVNASSSEQKVTFISLKALEKIEPTTERLIGFPFDFRGTATVDLPLAASDITALNTPITDTNRKKDNFMATMSGILISEVKDSSTGALEQWESDSVVWYPTNVKEAPSRFLAM